MSNPEPEDLRVIRSMTGWGEAERVTPAGRLRAEAKAVNHRYFSANVRLPASLERFDGPIREWLRALLPRGHINFSLRLESDAEAAAAGPSLVVDEARAQQYLDALRHLQSRFDLAGEIDVALVSRFGELFVRRDEGVLEMPEEEVRAVTEGAARAVLHMRDLEGAKLVEDLEDRLASIEHALEAVERRAPERLTRERDRLRAAVSELASEAGVDEDRLAREVAFLVERWDISEETVRLRAHIQLFRELVASPDEEPVGKRLGFVVQEMHRETNTIGSKANDAPIEHHVVAIKNELERLREQVENVE